MKDKLLQVINSTKDRSKALTIKDAIWITGSIAVGVILYKLSVSMVIQYNAAMLICISTAFVMIARFVFSKLNFPLYSTTIVLIFLAIASYSTQTHNRLHKFIVKKRPASFHYFLGSKYFNELEYYGLYRYSVLADSKLPDPQLGNLKRIRHLEDLSRMNIKDAREMAQRERNQYFPGPARWNEFINDWGPIARHSQAWRRKLNDHGFNPSPFWNVIPGFIAQFVKTYEANKYVFIRLIDLMIFLIILGFIAYHISVDSALLGFIFISSAVSWYYPYSFVDTYFQYQWFNALMLAVLFYRFGKTKLSAISLAYATMVRIFPVIFIAGPGLVWIRNLIKDRKIPLRETTYLATFAISLVAFTIIGLTQGKGPSTTKQFCQNITQHADEITFHGNKYGLKRTMSIKLNNLTENIEARNHQGFFYNQKHIYYFMFLLLFALTVMALFFKNEMDDWIIPLGAIFIYLLTTTSRYYYLFLIVFFIPHKERKYSLFYTVAMAMIFLIHAPLYATRYKSHHGFNIFNLELLLLFTVLPALMLIRKFLEVKKNGPITFKKLLED